MRTAFLILAFLQTLAAQPDRFGRPACEGPNQELAVRATLILCYDSEKKVALWSAHELKSENLASPAPRPRSRFRHDSQLSGASAFDSDYRNSGFSRGHLVPAADVASNDESFDASFLLTNAVPQDLAMNIGPWRRLENQIRKLAASSDSLIIFTGPVFCESIERIGPGKVAVPCELFKVILSTSGSHWTMFAAIMPNSAIHASSLDPFFTSVHDVELRTGFDFFHQLPASTQQQLESATNSIPLQ
jgi:endonuclease G